MIAEFSIPFGGGSILEGKAWGYAIHNLVLSLGYFTLP